MSQTSAPAPTPSRGLEGVTALDTELSYINGQEGTLIYRGYGIQDLATNASFEESSPEKPRSVPLPGA